MPPDIAQGQTLSGPQFAEPMRAETARGNGVGGWELGLVGTRSDEFRRVSLTAEDLAGLTIAAATPSYRGDGRLLRLAISWKPSYEQEPIKRRPCRPASRGVK